jgi:hypothetical protein
VSAVRHAAVPFAVALVAFAAWLWWTPDVFTGDEPHYLVVADSIVHDHTLDLRAAYADPHGVRELLPGLVDDHGIDARHDGRLVPVPQGLGLPVLVAPVWALTGSLLAVRVWMVLVAALFAQQLFLLLEDLVPDRPRLAWGVWAACVLTLPVLAFSNQLYPEVPAALLLTVALRALHRLPGPGSSAAAWWAGGALALLPWFHARYSVFAVVLGVAAIVRLARARRSVVAVVAVVAPLAVSAVALLGSYQLLYGEWWPPRVYGLIPHAAGASRLATGYRLVTGSLLAPTEGLLVFAPVFLVACAGLVVAVRASRLAAVAVVAAAAYLFLVVPFVPLGRFGSDLPSRFVVVLVPVLAVVGAVALAHVPRLIVAAAALLALSAVLAVSVGRSYVRSFIDADTIEPVASVARFLPWVNDTVGADHHRFTVAERIAGTSAPGVPSAAARGDVLAVWQPLRLRHARYEARVPALVDGPPGAPAVRVDAVVGDHEIAAHTYTVGALQRAPAGVSLAFDVPRDDAIVRLDVAAAGPVAGIVVQPPRLDRTGPAPARDHRVRASVPATVAWVGAIALAATLVGWRRPARADGSVRVRAATS